MTGKRISGSYLDILHLALRKRSGGNPFHYFGVGRGHLIYDKVVGRPRKHTPWVNYAIIL